VEPHAHSCAFKQLVYIRAHFDCMLCKLAVVRGVVGGATRCVASLYVLGNVLPCKKHYPYITAFLHVPFFAFSESWFVAL
jgi:hypothetical protein